MLEAGIFLILWPVTLFASYKFVLFALKKFEANN